jgi:hypothetical protein
VLPHGESLRRAIAWISECRELEPQKKVLALVEEASLRFDLSPNEEEWLLHMLTKSPEPPKPAS